MDDVRYFLSECHALGLVPVCGHLVHELLRLPLAVESGWIVYLHVKSIAAVFALSSATSVICTIAAYSKRKQTPSHTAPLSFVRLANLATRLSLTEKGDAYDVGASRRQAGRASHGAPFVYGAAYHARSADRSTRVTLRRPCPSRRQSLHIASSVVHGRQKKKCLTIFLKKNLRSCHDRSQSTSF